MRAAVCHGPRDIRIEEVPRPRPAPGEVLVRVHANGICGTDAAEFAGPAMYPLHARHGLTGHQGPLIPGHEFAGTIAEIGDDVEGFAEGEAIVTGAALWCGECAQCRAGRTSICVHYATVGLHRDGGLAQFVRVPAHIVFRAEPFGLSADAAVLTQPMAIAVHALRRGAPKAGEHVLVIGAGGIGAFLTSRPTGSSSRSGSARSGRFCRPRSRRPASRRRSCSKSPERTTESPRRSQRSSPAVASSRSGSRSIPSRSTCAA